jgi:hypothetical protein
VVFWVYSGGGEFSKSFPSKDADIPLQIWTGRVPYSNRNTDFMVIQDILAGIPPYRRKHSASEQEDSLWVLMAQCWALQAEDRPSIKDVVDSLSEFKGHVQASVS